jgi:hypothetical protein
MDLMVQDTQAFIDGGASIPIFEATFEYDGVLIRVDVPIAVDNGWRAIEVKAPTSVRD